jgi:hypothetical protein
VRLTSIGVIGSSPGVVVAVRALGLATALNSSTSFSLSTQCARRKPSPEPRKGSYQTGRGSCWIFCRSNMIRSDRSTGVGGKPPPRPARRTREVPVPADTAHRRRY